MTEPVDITVEILRLIQADISGIKHDMGGLKDDVAHLKVDVAEVKRSVYLIEEDRDRAREASHVG
jgi:hypothetical protein